MTVNTNDVSYMKGYLKHALEFEKYVYIWEYTMKNVNSRIKKLYDERDALESIKVSVENRLYSFDDVNERNYAYNENLYQKHIKNKKGASKVITVSIILSILFLAASFIALSNNKAEYAAFLMPTAIFILNIILPISLIVFFWNKSKSKKYKEESEKLSGKHSGRRQKILLQAKKDETCKKLTANTTQQSIIVKQKEEIISSLSKAKNNLKQIYQENILPIKYRNLNAVATLYEYLETGRCNTIEGHGGIYDTYEVEKVHLAQLQQMIQMNNTLYRIEDNQRYICRELSQVNKTLTGINKSLYEIEKTNTQIARNTEISAVANQQTAAATQWMAWHAWAHGY